MTPSLIITGFRQDAERMAKSERNRSVVSRRVAAVIAGGGRRSSRPAVALDDEDLNALPEADRPSVGEAALERLRLILSESAVGFGASGVGGGMEGRSVA